MKRFVRWAVLGLGLVASLAHAAYSVDQLMADLAQNKGGRARFVEKHFVALLDKPVVASGEMLYTPPDRLEKHTLLPKPETMVLDKDTLSMERDKRRMSINVSSRPEAQAFVESIRSTLSGNRKALEAHYQTGAAGRACRLDADPVAHRARDRGAAAACHGQWQPETGATHRIPAGRW